MNSALGCSWGAGCSRAHLPLQTLVVVSAYEASGRHISHAVDLWSLWLSKSSRPDRAFPLVLLSVSVGLQAGPNLNERSILFSQS